MSVKELGEQILNALKTVEHDELGKDIVSLGYIKNLRIKQGKINFDIALPMPNDPVSEELKTQAIEVVGKIQGVSDVAVRIILAEKPEAKEKDPWVDRAPIPGVKRIIAVASGKGGVGKSTIAANLAAGLAAAGLKTGLLDADIYGPSVAMMMGVPAGERPSVREGKILPIERYDVKTISIAFLLSEANAPVIWRGPMVGKMLKQLLTDVDWGELDALVVDLPPGTGDAQLTLVQSVPIDGSVIVTTPQKLAAMDATRGIEMFRKVQVPVLGIIENMSKFVCPHCKSEHDIFPRGGVEEVESLYNVPVLARIPVDLSVGEQGDTGLPEILANPKSPASVEIKRMVEKIVVTLNLGS